MITAEELLGIFAFMGTGMVSVFAGLDGVYVTSTMSVLDLYIYLLVLSAVIDFISTFIFGE